MKCCQGWPCRPSGEEFTVHPKLDLKQYPAYTVYLISIYKSYKMFQLLNMKCNICSVHCSFCVLCRPLFGVGNVHNLWRMCHTMCHAWRAKCNQRGKRNTVKFVPPGHTFRDSAPQTISPKDKHFHIKCAPHKIFAPISTLDLNCVWGWFDRELETFKFWKGFSLPHLSLNVIVSDTQAIVFSFSTICWPLHCPECGIVMPWKGRQHCELMPVLTWEKTEHSLICTTSMCNTPWTH